MGIYRKRRATTMELRQNGLLETHAKNVQECECDKSQLQTARRSEFTLVKLRADRAPLCYFMQSMPCVSKTWPGTRTICLINKTLFLMVCDYIYGHLFFICLQNAFFETDLLGMQRLSHLFAFQGHFTPPQDR